MLEKWQIQYFNKYYRLIHSHQTEQVSLQEAEQIVSLLRLSPRDSILDLGCGYGRHSFHLYNLGMDVTGIDHSRYFIRLARQEALKRGEEGPKFICRDYRKLAGSNRFDAVISIYTSFGFYSDEDNFDVLRRAARALKPAGKLLLDINNHDKLVTDIARCPKSWRQLGSVNYVMDEFSYNPLTQRCQANRNFFVEGKMVELTFEFRSYTYRELRSMLLAAGLHPKEVFGNLNGFPFNSQSARLVIVSEKPA